jgi:Leucine-rich repeat (LRR) protein
MSDHSVPTASTRDRFTDSAENLGIAATATNQSRTEPEPRRRSWLRFLRPRFSLRTMMVLITVVCILIPTWILPSERQRRVVKQLDEKEIWWAFSGEEIDEIIDIYNHSQSSNNLRYQGKHERRWYQHFYRNIESVQIESARAINDHTIDWSALPHLKSIRAWSTDGLLEDGASGEPINQFFQNLSNNRELAALDLTLGEMTDEAMKVIGSFENLRSLKISDGPTSDNGMIQLKNLKKLKLLEIFPSRISVEGLAMLASLPQLEHLSLKISEPKIIPAFTTMGKLPSLKELTLPRETTDELLECINQQTSLEVLRIDKNDITDNGLAQLKEMTKLQRLFLYSPKLDGSGLRHLSKMQKLTYLHLSGERKLDPSFIDHILQLKELRQIVIYGMETTTAQAKRLLDLPVIENIQLFKTGISVSDAKLLNENRNVFNIRQELD